MLWWYVHADVEAFTYCLDGCWITGKVTETASLVTRYGHATVAESVSAYDSTLTICYVLKMGLGKTAQSIAVLETQRQAGHPGPFLVVAPLTTLGKGTFFKNIVSWFTRENLSYLACKIAYGHRSLETRDRNVDSYELCAVHWHKRWSSGKHIIWLGAG